MLILRACPHSQTRFVCFDIRMDHKADGPVIVTVGGVFSSFLNGAKPYSRNFTRADKQILVSRRHIYRYWRRKGPSLAAPTAFWDADPARVRPHEEGHRQLMRLRRRRVSSPKQGRMRFRVTCPSRFKPPFLGSTMLSKFWIA